MDRLHDIIAGFFPYTFFSALTRQRSGAFFDELHSTQEGLFIKNALYLDKHQPALPALFHWILSRFPHSFSFPFKLKRTEQSMSLSSRYDKLADKASRRNCSRRERQTGLKSHQLHKIFDKYCMCKERTFNYLCFFLPKAKSIDNFRKLY